MCVFMPVCDSLTRFGSFVTLQRAIGDGYTQKPEQLRRTPSVWDQQEGRRLQAHRELCPRSEQETDHTKI